MEGNGEKKTYIRWIVAVVLIFALMGASIYGVAKKTYDDMSDAAIQNLNENLNLMRNTVEAIMRSEAEFQQLVAEEIAAAPDPSSYVLNLRNNDTTSKLSVVLAGEEAGASNDGEPFFPEQLDFSAGGAIAGLPVSQSYVNDAGTWAYTIACPIAREGEDVGTLYAEYTPTRPSTGRCRWASTTSRPCSTSWTRPRSASCCSPRAWASVTRGT